MKRRYGDQKANFYGFQARFVHKKCDLNGRVLANTADKPGGEVRAALSVMLNDDIDALTERVIACAIESA